MRDDVADFAAFLSFGFQTRKFIANLYITTKSMCRDSSLDKSMMREHVDRLAILHRPNSLGAGKQVFTGQHAMKNRR